MIHLLRVGFLSFPLALVIACSGSVDDTPEGDGDGDVSGDGDGDGDGDVSGDGDGTPANLEEALDGREFVLESADGYTLVADTTAQVSFGSGEISFAAGCNEHFAEKNFDGDRLVAEGFGSTDRACETELMDQDAWFTAFFSDRPTVTIDGDRVTFTTEDATLVFLDDEVANPPPPLVGTVWEIWALTERNSASGGYDVVPTVTFDADGTVHVFSGCNNGEGEYEFDDTTITFSGGIGYTEAGCADAELADVEAHMQSIFTTGEVTYSFNRQDLAIEKGDVGVRAREQE